MSKKQIKSSELKLYLLGYLGLLFITTLLYTLLFLATHDGISLDFLRGFLEGRRNCQAEKRFLTSALSLSLRVVCFS